MVRSAGEGETANNARPFGEGPHPAAAGLPMGSGSARGGPRPFRHRTSHNNGRGRGFDPLILMQASGTRSGVSIPNDQSPRPLTAGTEGARERRPHPPAPSPSSPNGGSSGEGETANNARPFGEGPHPAAAGLPMGSGSARGRPRPFRHRTSHANGRGRGFDPLTLMQASGTRFGVSIPNDQSPRPLTAGARG